MQYFPSLACSLSLPEPSLSDHCNFPSLKTAEARKLVAYGTATQGEQAEARGRARVAEED